MKLHYTTLDVFTKTRLAGNPLSVIQLPTLSSLPKPVKQAIAKEFNLSEIVFIGQDSIDQQKADVPIEIFTSVAEVPFAGHPTIGTAFYLLNILGSPSTALVPKAGRFSISGAGDGVAAELAHNVRVHAKRFSTVMGIQGPVPVVSIVKGMTFLLVHMADLEALAQPIRNLKERTYEPEDLDEGWNVGLIASFFYVQQGQDETGTQRLRTRMIGSREDPATGSASSALSCYLALQEPREKGKGPFRFALTQGVEMGRRSDISVVVERTEDGSAINKVMLSGAATRVMDGTLEIDV